MISKQKLKKMYYNNSTKYCIKKLSISRWKFYDLLHKYKIPIKQQKQYSIDINLLKDMYIKKNIDVKKIAEKFNISSVYLYKILKKNNIKKRRIIKTNKHITKKDMKQAYDNSKNYREAARKLGVTSSWFGRHMKKFDLKPRLNPKGRKRIKNRNGFTIDNDGRKHIYMPNHHRAVGDYVSNSILIMEKHIGRKLNKDEIVHHIDLDCSNDDINNLQLLENRSAHSKIHSKIYKNKK